MLGGGSLSDGLAGLPIPAIGAGTLFVMLASAAGGRAIRKLQQRRQSSKVRESGESVAQEGYLLGSALGLLGLLLAFSFGMVLNRYEARRELVTKEANAIGTAYLRAQLLDEPHRSRLSQLLTVYADNRVQLATFGPRFAEQTARNDQLLIEIWAAIRASRESAFGHGLTTALLVAYNEVIDLDTERKVAWNLRMPAEVLVLLLIYLALVAVVVGHQVDGSRGRRAAFVLFVLMTLSITVISDINRPMSGSVRDSQEAMVMLARSLRTQEPGVFDRFVATSQRLPEMGR
jgi:hypothetical protein